MGQDPWHGNGPSLIHALSPNGQGDVTESRRLWTSRDVGRVVGTPIAQDGLLYVGDLGGTLHCLDAATGDHVWKHETSAAIWGCLLLARDRLYVGNVDGSLSVLRAGRRKELLAQIEMEAPLYSRPALVGDALYLATANRLYLITAKNLNPVSLKSISNSTHQSRCSARDPFPDLAGGICSFCLAAPIPNTTVIPTNPAGFTRACLRGSVTFSK
jgi:outer membrane protein assembly factor BamB